MFDALCETLRHTASLGILPSYLATQPLSPDMRLIDLGIDSLGTMTLISEIGGRLSAPLPEIDLDPTATLGDIAQALADAVHGRGATLPEQAAP